ncbi:hypothetical protein ACFX1T_003363 [Malus domestica]
MIFLTWNCRGIGQDSTVDVLRDRIHLNKPFIVFLSETKARRNGIETLRRSMGYQHRFFVEAIGQSGGLCLWWKDNLEVQIIFSSVNAIDTCVQEFVSGSVIHITWMYGPPPERIIKELFGKNALDHLQLMFGSMKNEEAERGR